MTIVDADLLSIQEARDCAVAANKAAQAWLHASQEEVDRVCEAMATAAFTAAERLGTLAHEETGYGVAEHKRLKNEFASKAVWDSIADVATVGVVKQDFENRLTYVAWPMGNVAALTPSTNPTSTVMAKVLTSVKARNSIVVAPHPSAAKCSLETANVMALAAENAGAPKDLVQCISKISLPGTQELMRHKYISLILATGGTPMVKAAHSVGKPALGVGPGNVPVYVDRSADLEKAARYIVASKSFDFSTICATEQAVIADRPIANKLMQLMQDQGAYFVDAEQAKKLSTALFYANGGINPLSVGKSPQYLAAMAGISIPESARIIVAPLQKVGPDEPLSREKLTTVLGWYTVDEWEEGCERSMEMIRFGGRGHTQIIHATNEDVILAFGLEKPVFRILVNTMGTLGAVGLTTGVMPSMTLGAGGFGGSITGDNITVYHLFNLKRLAYELREPPAAAMLPGANPAGPSPQDIEKAVEEVVYNLLLK
ncbi:MAG: aldehyde dehydrogenase family protein [Anaerolineaceae bacterium]|nr:aldehyde dehydrogenase family protein [Anaerolineaceae bacterium]